MSEGDPRESSGVFLPSMMGESAAPGDNSESAPEGGAGLIGVGADLPTGESAARKASTGTLILLLVVVVAGGSLAIMRQFGLGTRLHLIDVKIDYPVEQSRAEDIAQQRKVLAELRDSATSVQVPLDEVKKNPFELALNPEALQAAPPPAPVDRQAIERERRATLIRTTLASLEVNSIVGGSIPIARISGENVRVGDTVRNLFVVKSIVGRTVELAVDGQTFTLTMGR